MKKLITVFVCLITYTAYAQTKNEKEILAVLNKQTTEGNKANIEAFMAGYWQSDSLMFIGKAGITYGYHNTLGNYKKNYGDTAQMGKLFFDILQIKKIAADYYFVVGKWFLKRSVGNVGGHYTLLFKKIKGRWLIIADHSS
jgi:ketosteroid isomerase-like protein